MSEKIVIKENANGLMFNLGLEKHGRSKFPGCADIIQPSMSSDGRWVTGLDELAVSIRSIQNSDEREKEKARVRELRENLENMTGLDLGPFSTYWDSYTVRLESERTFNLDKPEDIIAYNILLANKKVAPTLKDTQNMDYVHTKFYVSRENEDVSDKISRKRKINQAGSILEELIEDHDKVVVIGRYLGLSISENMPKNNIYDHFQSAIDADVEANNFVDRFLSAMEKSPEELNIKLIFDDAMKFKVIRSRDGLFQRGNVTLGRRAEDVISYLSNPENSGELLSIKEEIEDKKKFG